MRDDGTPVQRDNLAVTAQRPRIFSSVSFRLNILVDEVPCRCPYKYEIILRVALVSCLASELSSPFLFACFHSLIVRALRLGYGIVGSSDNTSQVHESSMRQ